MLIDACHRLKRLPSEGLLNSVFDDLAHVDHLPDFRDGAQHRITLEDFPIGVVADESSLILGNSVVESALDLGARQPFGTVGTDRMEGNCSGSSLPDIEVRPSIRAFSRQDEPLERTLAYVETRNSHFQTPAMPPSQPPI